ncbi:ABC-type antimicrobial peptide transport system, permease component [Nocardioides exalbidus]|uniref:ABC-type antimicrobial peptide transport system, permease component n=1 Tax=Nocardioides exalbidus TaxID=402596 RepID=A0A1H4WHX8_9ACTN|nr:FtsX-like permease family protein [Nocardioides exalbidus]SEC92865.1 ABC-type antimicrobial peptide transport system, permease component [Nocardioides exalbidus]
MLTLVLRRARVQRRLLAWVVVLVATACTLVGTCVLVLGATQERAFHVAVEQSEPEDVSVTAFLVDLAGDDVTAAAQEAGDVVESVLAPMRPTLETTLTSRLRRLEGADQAYLSATDDLSSRADLVSGRWPEEAASGPAEAVVPATTARLLDLDLGEEVQLGRETGLGGVDAPVTVTVVGTFQPRAGVEWERDPLGGAGFSPNYSDGLEAAPTYGPFVVTQQSFLASGSSVNGLRVTAHPVLRLADDSSLTAAVESLGEASGALSSRVGDRARITRVASELPRTLARIHSQQDSTRSTVLVVLLLGMALSLAAALLAGRLVASVRADERALLVAVGLSRRQQLGAAGVEAVLLSLAAAAIAVPAAVLVHWRLTHLADLAAAGLGQGPTVTPATVLAVLGAGVLLTGALLSATVAPDRAPDPSPRRAALARLGVDGVLLVAAVAAWWQLRSRPSSVADGPGDVTLTFAPVLCLAVLVVLGVRVVPFLLTAAARAAGRTRGLIGPLAAQQAARRPRTGTAMVLVAAAVAAAVFGLALRTTWDRSQADQAALRVGTDLALTLPAPAGLEDATAVAAAVRGQTPAPVVSPVIHRPLALGRYIGEEGSRPALVAIDATQAGALLRGRAQPGTTWADVGAGLMPAEPAASIAVPDEGSGIRLRGRGPAGAGLTVSPTAVLEDPTGFRTAISAEPVALDGASHPVDWIGTLGPGLRLVALRLDLGGTEGASPDAAAQVRVSVRVPPTGEEVADGPPWQVLALQESSPVSAKEVTVRTSGSGTVLRADLTVNLVYFQYTGADVLATAFPVPGPVPVAVSQDLVDAVGAHTGDELSAIVGDTVLALRVVSLVPSVPSAPGQVAVLADADTLSRALVDDGRLEPVVDAWWVSRPTAATTAALRSLELGDVTTRAGVATQLSQGPLRVSVPATLLALVALAVAMLLAAVGLVLGADRQRQVAGVVRLRAIGLTRREVRRLLLVEHLVFFAPLVVVSTVVGVAATLLLAPHLVRSDLGAEPVPRALVAWPWTAETLLVAGVLLGTAVMTTIHAGLLVRQSDPARLRAGDR